MDYSWLEIIESREKEAEQSRYAIAAFQVSEQRNRLREIEGFIANTNDYDFAVNSLKTRVQSIIESAIDLTPPSGRWMSDYHLLEHLSHLHQCDWPGYMRHLYRWDSAIYQSPSLREKFERTFEGAPSLGEEQFSEILRALVDYFDNNLSPEYHHSVDDFGEATIYSRKDANRLLQALYKLIALCERLIEAGFEYPLSKESVAAVYPPNYEGWIADELRGMPPNEVEESRLETGDYSMDELEVFDMLAAQNERMFEKSDEHDDDNCTAVAPNESRAHDVWLAYFESAECLAGEMKTLVRKNFDNEDVIRAALTAIRSDGCAIHQQLRAILLSHLRRNPITASAAHAIVTWLIVWRDDAAAYARLASEMIQAMPKATRLSLISSYKEFEGGPVNLTKAREALGL